VENGETLRVAGLDARPLCVIPSLQVSVQGGAPVRTTVRFVDCPAQIVALPETAAVGGAETGMVLDELDEQLPTATVTESWSDPLVPGLKVIDRVPAPPVIVPFVIDQLYVAPGPASGTEAESPDEPVQAADGALIADERAATVTVA
jgi:hypothetical protein